MFYPTAPGTAVEKNGKAWIDYSNSAEGYIMAECLMEDLHLCKTEMSKGDEKIIFDMYPNPDVLPLMFGDGKYGLRIMVQSPSDPAKYAVAFATTIDVKMRECGIRFKYPNQRVNYTHESKAVAKAVELCRGAKTEAEKIIKIYSFIIDNFTYDHKLASAPPVRYLPDCDRTLERKTGICCDIAELFTVMCRSQGLSCKYATGYVKPPTGGEAIYHAYCHVRVNNDTTLPCGVKISKNKWTIIDPTFGMSNKGGKGYVNFMTNPASYADKHLY